MHALELEPEGAGRWQRFALGAAFATFLTAGAAFAAQRIEPMARALSVVVPIAIVEQAPPPEPPPVQPPPPEPPAPKPQAQPKPAPAPAAPPPDAPPPDESPPPEQPIGLDAESFGKGGSGPAFAVGTSQLGAPAAPRRASSEIPVKRSKRKPKLIEARPRNREKLVEVPAWARRENITGLMVIEIEVDKSGRVVRADVRGKLHPKLDSMVREALLKRAFVPATLDGQAIASTRFIRVRFLNE